MLRSVLRIHTLKGETLMSLTNAWLKSNLNKPVNKPYMQADRDGLNVRVSAKGTLTFTMRFRHAGKADQMALGSYPTMSLAEARELNEIYRKKLADGINPKAAKKEHLAQNIEALTFEQLFEEWFARHIKGQFGDKRENVRRNMFKRDIFPVFGARLAKSITIHEWLKEIERVQKRAPTTAEYLLIMTKQIYHFGITRELVPSNPLVNISATRDLKIKRNVGERVFDDKELHMVLNALDNSKMTRPYQLFAQFCLLYGCRPGELRLAKKTDFDFEEMVWTVPPENHKTGKFTKKPLVRPIIKEAIPLIKELFSLSVSEWAISTTRTNASIGKNFGEPLKETFYTRIAGDLKKVVKKTYDFDMEDWTFYAFRKTMRTNMGRIGEETRESIAPFHVCEIMVGHKIPGQWAVYDKHDYLNQQREAYSAWWAKIHSVKAGMDNVKVVNFR